MSSKVRTRFAPSPTGYLHVGGARSALFNYLFAKHHKGDFVFRVEDTDQVRSTEESLRMQIQDLQWLGLKWDEGVHPVTLADVGPHGPYRQSHRLSLYKTYADKLLACGKAYYCFLTDEEIEAQKKAASGADPHSFHIQSPYQDWSLEKAKAKLESGAKAVVRFRTRDLKKDYVFKDLIRGEVSFPSDMVGDFVLLRSDGMPVYNFSCMVDDSLMEISHVLRAEEHLPNTLRQLMLYEALEKPLPLFGHISLILGEDKQKLSKRHGATSCHDFKERGFLPEAMNNYLALLGWSHPEEKELLEMEEVIRDFSLERVNAAPAVFDEVKLTWMNSVYLRKLPSSEIWKGIESHVRDFELPSKPEWQHQSAEVFKNAISTFSEAREFYKALSDKEFHLFTESEEVFSWEPTRNVLRIWQSLLTKETTEFLSAERFDVLQEEVKKQALVKGKNLFMPIRVAVIGKPHGTDLKMLVPLMPVKSLIKRANICLERLGDQQT